MPGCEYTAAGKPKAFHIRSQKSRTGKLKGPYITAIHYIGQKPITGMKVSKRHSIGKITNGVSKLKYKSPYDEEILRKISLRLNQTGGPALPVHPAGAGTATGSKYGNVTMSKIAVGKATIVYLWECPEDGKEICDANLGRETFLIRRHLGTHRNRQRAASRSLTQPTGSAS